MYNVSTMYNVQPCPYIYIYMSVYVYEYGYVCRIMSGICAYTHEYTDIHTCVYMCVYAQCMCTNFSTPTETGREAHLVQGTASLSADGPVSVPRFSHCQCLFLQEFSCYGQPRVWAVEKWLPAPESAWTCLCTRDTCLPSCCAGRQAPSCSQLGDSDRVCPAQSRGFSVFLTPQLLSAPVHSRTHLVSLAEVAVTSIWASKIR